MRTPLWQIFRNWSWRSILNWSLSISTTKTNECSYFFWVQWLRRHVMIWIDRFSSVSLDFIILKKYKNQFQHQLKMNTTTIIEKLQLNKCNAVYEMKSLNDKHHLIELALWYVMIVWYVFLWHFFLLYSITSNMGNSMKYLFGGIRIIDYNDNRLIYSPIFVGKWSLQKHLVLSFVEFILLNQIKIVIQDVEWSICSRDKPTPTYIHLWTH